ncbi:hypothetical protein BV25DRAFT_1696921 [Artomyces pyxidatus]|uniref:Uncharacterized protein n=1 Tax=Artomyces pyxidatus TaxID=48021 RepID=A0ACB8TAG1_9AGAM|nr:hypothetical protein BV25DRAFT_1696921 [Artomyces pyxidatus]
MSLARRLHGGLQLIFFLRSRICSPPITANGSRSLSLTPKPPIMAHRGPGHPVLANSAALNGGRAVCASRLPLPSQALPPCLPRPAVWGNHAPPASRAHYVYVPCLLLSSLALYPRQLVSPFGLQGSFSFCHTPHHPMHHAMTLALDWASMLRGPRSWVTGSDISPYTCGVMELFRSPCQFSR